LKQFTTQNLNTRVLRTTFIHCQWWIHLTSWCESYFQRCDHSAFHRPKTIKFMRYQVWKWSNSLILWEPGHDIFVLQLRPKTSSCQLPYQRPSSSADCARELFKGSNRSDSLVECTRKKLFWLGSADFLWVTS